MSQFTQDGVIYEELPDGNVRVVGHAAQSSPMVVPPNPARVAQQQQDNARANASAQSTLTNTAQDNTRANTKERIDNPQSLRQEFDRLPEVKAYKVAVQQLAQALNTGADPQADLALTYSFAKAMDPDSVVREAEGQMISNSQPLFQAAVENTKKQFGMDEAGNYTPAARAALRQQIIRSVDTRNTIYQDRRKYYTDLANRNGIDPVEVIGNDIGEGFRQQFRAYDDKRRKEGATVGTEDQPQAAAPGYAPPSGGAGPSINVDPSRVWQQASNDPTQIAGKNSVFLAPKQRGEYDYGVASKVNQMIRAGESDAAINAYSRSMGYGDVGDTTAVRAYIADPRNKGYTGSLVNPPMKMVDTGLPGRFNGAALGTGLRNALPFVGATDEVVGGVNSLLNGTGYEQERDQADYLRKSADAAHPVAQGVGMAAGALASGYGAAKLAPSLVAGLSNPLAATGAGATYGAISGAADENQARLAGALGGALEGATGGLIGQQVGKRIIAPVVSAALRSDAGQAGVRKVAGLFGSKTPAIPPTISAGEKHIIKQQPDLAPVLERVRTAEQMGLPYALADADPQLRALGGYVSRTTPENYAIAENFIEPRLLGQNDRAIQAVSTHLAEPVDLAARAQHLKDTAGRVSAPIYEKAFAANQPSWSPRIQQFLDDPTSKTALAKSMNTQRMESLASGNEFSPTRFSVTNFNAAGEPVISSVPNLRTVDGIRRGYGEMLDSLPQNIHGKPIYTPYDRAIAQSKGSLTDELDRVTLASGNPHYAQARETYGQFMGMKDALEQGYKDMPRGTFARDMKPRIDQMTPDQLGEYQAGYATRARDEIANQGDGVNAFRTTYGGIERRAKMEEAFPQGAQNFGRQYELERDMAKTALEVTGNSATARRQGLDSAMGSQLSTALEVAGQLQGVPGAGYVASKGLGGLAKWQLGRAQGKVANELTPLLFSDAGKGDVVAYLTDLLSRNEAIAAEATKWGRRGGLFGAAAAPAFTPAR